MTVREMIEKLSALPMDAHVAALQVGYDPDLSTDIGFGTSRGRILDDGRIDTVYYATPLGDGVVEIVELIGR